MLFIHCKIDDIVGDPDSSYRDVYKRQLCKNKNRLSPREVLLLAGWNSTAYNYESQLNKVIRKLRKLLMRENQVKIILDKGNGYWLKTEEDIHI